MGLYIDPEVGTKEEWLRRKGEPIQSAASYKEGTKLAVCLVDNGPFTAASVMFRQEELDVFGRADGRLKRWFLVEETDIRDVCGELAIHYLGAV